MKRFLLFCFILTGFISVFPEIHYQQGNETIKSFSRAKRYLHRVIYSDDPDRTTFYCNCKYDDKGKIDWGSCGYVPGRQRKRAKRLEWEHVVPAHAFGKDLPEWKFGHPECITRAGKPFKGRNCASKVNKKFQLMIADMYNLVPSVGEINAVRSNYPFKEKTTDSRPYGECDFRVIDRKAMPADHTKGKIARIYMYMESAYPGFGIIHHKNRKMFEKWDAEHGVTDRECYINQEIEKIQGNRNHIVHSRCQDRENGLNH